MLVKCDFVVYIESKVLKVAELFHCFVVECKWAPTQLVVYVIGKEPVVLFAAYLSPGSCIYTIV